MIGSRGMAHLLTRARRVGRRLSDATGRPRIVGRLISAAASVWLLVATLPITIQASAGFPMAYDFNLYRGAATRWLAGGQFYPASQLVGNWHISDNAILYPPVIL